jgi:hypothetical protein
MADKKETSQKEEKQEIPPSASAGSFSSGYSHGWVSAAERDKQEMERRVRRELALRHKFGEVYRAKHDEEILGLLRDPDTPPETKHLVYYYANMFGQLFQVQDEIEENNLDIQKAKDEKEPLLEIKYTQYKAILEKNKKLRINHLITDKKILHASRLFPQGVETIPEKEYRELGTGRILVGPESLFGRKKAPAEAAEEGETGGEEESGFG